MQIFNSMSRRKEEFVPIEEGKVRMYCCGPTVYNFIHVGNARPIIMFDVLRRYLEYRGYDVTFVQNFTDVDDKIIKQSIEEGISFSQVAEKYIGEYFTDARGLGVRPATVHPRATENIPQIIGLVQTLIDKGFAYPAANGDVYYRTLKFQGYGKLSHQPIEDLMSGARIEVNDGKENPLDFALWKAAKPGEPAWDSPWSKGRPGWHIECSAMSNRYLGKTIDIHCGGEDLQFPHHENEIAQSEAANGCEFVHYWMHNGFLNIDNKKMSKSLNNFFTVREAAAAYGYDTIRFFMISAHYRSPLNYSADILNQCKSSLNRLRNAWQRVEELTSTGAEGEMKPQEQAVADSFAGYRVRFDEAMDDDFNTANAVSVYFELVRAVNGATAEKNAPTRAFARKCLDIMGEFNGVLGLLYDVPQAGGQEEAGDTAWIEERIAARAEAKKMKNWAEADRIREELKEKGILLKDSKQGTTWERA